MHFVNDFLSVSSCHSYWSASLWNPLHSCFCGPDGLQSWTASFSIVLILLTNKNTGADPGFFSGGGALVSCSTSTPINHIVFWGQNTSCIRKPQVISGGGGAHPLHPSPRSAPGTSHWSSIYSEIVNKKHVHELECPPSGSFQNKL